MAATNPIVDPRRGEPSPRGPSREVVTLAEALDRLLYTGVSVEGRVAVGLADVELLFLDLRLLLGSVDTIWPGGRPPFRPVGPPERPSSPVRAGPRPPPPAPKALPAPAVVASTAADVSEPTVAPIREAAAPEGGARDGALTRALGGPAPRPSSSSTADGLVRLVLTLVKLLHEVLERQAVRRMSAGALSDAQIENVGAALFAQAIELEKLRLQFGFSDGDLALNLGPISEAT
jgi:hypothetical protein